MIGMNMAMQACHTSRGAAARPAAGLSGSRLGGPRPLARRLALCRLGRNNKPVASQDQQQQQQQDQRPRTAPPPAVDRVPAAAPRCTGNADKEESRKFRRVVSVKAFGTPLRHGHLVTGCLATTHSGREQPTPQACPDAMFCCCRARRPSTTRRGQTTEAQAGTGAMLPRCPGRASSRAWLSPW